MVLVTGSQKSASYYLTLNLSPDHWSRDKSSVTPVIWGQVHS